MSTFDQGGGGVGGVGPEGVRAPTLRVKAGQRRGPGEVAIQQSGVLTY